MYLSLFGGELPWSPLDWTALDDTVRGGSSYSNLDFDLAHSTAAFNGLLDTKTLGGAGFASQRTTGEDRVWNLSNYDGIALDIREADGKKYTFGLKDLLLPYNREGKEQSTIGWDHDFIAPPDGACLKLYWSDFKPIYRGREQNETAPLNLKQIKRFSLMMRSFFDHEHGAFSMSLASISAFTISGQDGPENCPISEYEKFSSNSDEKLLGEETSQRSIKMIE